MSVFNQFVDEITKLKKAVRNSSSQASIKQAFLLSKQIESAVHVEPIKLLSFSYAKIQQSKVTFEQACLCKVLTFIHLCKVNNYNRTSCHLLTASFGLLLITKPIHKQQQSYILKNLYSAFKAKNYDLAITLFDVRKLIWIENPIPYFSQLSLASWQWFAIVASTLCNHDNPLPWQEKFSRLLPSIPHWCQAYLFPLVHYPSFFPPGASVSYENSTLLVVSHFDDKLILSDGTALLEAQAIQCKYISDNSVTDIFPLLENIQERDLFKPIFRIDRPPKALLRVFEQTQAKDPLIEKLTKSIEKETSFAKFICESAETSNRLNISVTSVKQAVMTYGSMRLGEILTTHALFERLTQSEFPLKHVFVDHISLCTELAAQLASKTQIMTPQAASLLTLMCHSSLFTDTSLKLIATWKVAEVENEACFDNLVTGLSVTTMRVQSMALAKSWQLSAKLKTLLGEVLTPTPKLEKKPIALIYTALVWSLNIKKGSLSYTQITSKIEKKLISYLHLSDIQKQHCLESVQKHLVSRLYY